MEAVFWALVFLVLWGYGGYSLLLCFLPKTGRKLKPDTKVKTAKISLILAFHNEESAVPEQIEALLALQDKCFEVIVVSDGSTDQTNARLLALAHPQLKVVAYPEQKGKIQAHRMGVLEASGDILVFIDAMTYLPVDALSLVRKHFASDQRLGCMGAQVVLPKDKSVSGMQKGLGFFWRFERCLRSLQSERGGMVGVSGACYAIRASLFPHFSDGVQDDFAMPLALRKKGFYTRYVPEIEVEERGLNERASDEFSMRRRVALGSISTLFVYRSLFNVLRYGMFSLHLLSHKLLRHLIPVFLLLLLLLNFCLLSKHPIYILTLLAQVLVYALAVLGALLHHWDKPIAKWIALPYYFMLGNAAHLAAWYDFFHKKEHVMWTPKRGV